MRIDPPRPASSGYSIEAVYIIEQFIVMCTDSDQIIFDQYSLAKVAKTSKTKVANNETQIIGMVRC